MFCGRKKELDLLTKKYNSNKSELIVVYGRRRIGKTSLIKNFIANKPSSFSVEGIEGERTNYQIKSFCEKMLRISKEKYVESSSFNDWNKTFYFMTDKIINIESRSNKLILFFDEIQWMASGRSKLVSILKYFWDNYWKDMNVMLILCGSIASYMLRKVIKSTALYGRISTEILLKGLHPDEAVKIFRKKRSKEEILKYILIFGGIPKYLEEINLNKSFNQNINDLCFSKSSFLINEIEKIFYSQFREPYNYSKIVSMLRHNAMSLSIIANKLSQKSGGSLKESLRLLEGAEIIKSFIPFNKNRNSKLIKYKLSDEFLCFYYKYMEEHIDIINDGEQSNLFEMISKDNLQIWLGFAFERFCLKHSLYLADKMAFKDKVLKTGPYFSREVSSFQIDLIYKRIDKVITVCEIKYYNKEINTSIINEMEKKLSLLKVPRGYSVETALISLYGPNKQLKAADYFNYYITLDNIIP